MKEFDANKWYEKLDKVPAVIVRNKWTTFAGKIGSNSIVLEYPKEIYAHCTKGGYYYEKATHKKGQLGCRYETVDIPSSKREICHSGAQGFERYYMVKKTSDWSEHPSWRPLCIFYDYGSVYMDGRYYGGYDNGRRVLESWDDIEACISEYGDQTFYIYKHPRQEK